MTWPQSSDETLPVTLAPHTSAGVSASYASEHDMHVVRGLTAIQRSWVIISLQDRFDVTQ